MKIKRNDKCLCGSGLKYKKCCFLTDQKRKTLANEKFDEVAVYYGFDSKYEDVNPFLVDYEDPCCLVLKADAETAAHFNKQYDFNVLDTGEWYITGGAGFQKISMRFKTAEDAMVVAKEKYGAIRFLTLPDFI